jgi:hypothetical protein
VWVWVCVWVKMRHPHPPSRWFTDSYGEITAPLFIVNGRKGSVLPSYTVVNATVTLLVFNDPGYILIPQILVISIYPKFVLIPKVELSGFFENCNYFENCISTCYSTVF